MVAGILVDQYPKVQVERTEGPAILDQYYSSGVPGKQEVIYYASQVPNMCTDDAIQDPSHVWNYAAEASRMPLRYR